MCKTYYIPSEICSEIRGIILEWQVDQSQIIKVMKDCEKSGKTFTFSSLMKWERIVTKKAAKECNKKILSETGMYISKKTLAKVLNHLLYGCSFRECLNNYFIKY